MNRRALVPTILVLVIACGSGEGTEPEALTLDGTWQQSAHLVDPVNGDDHAHLGTFSFVQAGSSFSGTGEQSGLCATEGNHYTGPLAESAPFQITDGMLVGRDVSFKRDICTFTGSFVAGRSDRITGTATCTYTRNGTDYTFTGGWQADRLSK